MIRVNRTAPPRNLTRNTQRWTNELLAAIQQYEQGGSNPSNKFWNKYNKPYVKTALIEMFHRKCAYCETKHEPAALHIEHYRPKRRYPDCAFEWQNLLLACVTCNTVYKNEQFPLEDNDKNKPLLLNPCEDDPAQHLYFEQARLVSLAGSKRGQQTIELLGLNRDELFDRRRQCLREVHFIRHSIEKYRCNGNEDLVRRGEELLEVKTSAMSEYTAMVRQFMANPLPGQPPI